jgi:hypothetical protein
MSLWFYLIPVKKQKQIGQIQMAFWRSQIGLADMAKHVDSRVVQASTRSRTAALHGLGRPHRLDDRVARSARLQARFSDGEARRTGETSAAVAVAALPRPSDSDSEAPSKCWTEQQFAALGHRLLLGRIGQRVLGGVLRPARLVAELQSRRPTSLPSLLPLLWHSLAITHAPSGLWGLTSRPSAARLAAASGRSHLTAPRSGGTCVGSQV